MHSDHGNTKRFFYAAKLAQQKTLQQLLANCHLVSLVCDLIHELQKERGIDNIYLASDGSHYAQRRILQIKQSNAAQEALMLLLNKQYLDERQNTDNHRLLFSITSSLQGLDDLDILRASIERYEVSAAQSTEAFCQLISHLISIVFEAVDVSNDAAVTQVLIALCNFIQGKEYAGQERAWGAIGFAETHFDEALCSKLVSLQQQQDESVEVFKKYSKPQQLSAWQSLTQHQASVEVIKLRQLIQQLSKGDRIASQISEVWYELTTQRIDQMRLIERALAQQLVEVASCQLANAQASLNNHPQRVSPQMLQGQTASVPYSTLQKSLYDLLQGQAKRIEEMSDQLAIAKQTLSDQKTIGRAKLLLVQELNLSEKEAHQQLQKAAMHQSKTTLEVATSIIKAALLKP